MFLSLSSAGVVCQLNTDEISLHLSLPGKRLSNAGLVSLAFTQSVSVKVVAQNRENEGFIEEFVRVSISNGSPPLLVLCPCWRRNCMSTYIPK